MTDLQRIEQGWDQAAREDAFHNIITIIGLTEEEFWQRGIDEINGVLEGLGKFRHVRALDFGCGIGRLTQPLADHFLRVDGVDVSGEMIRLANEYNQHPHVHYHHNPEPDLALFDDDQFDLVYTMIVLQHTTLELAEGYVREFLRVARPGGFVVFQLPDQLETSRSDWLSMWGTSHDVVESWLDGAELLDIETSDGSGFTSHRYTVRA